MYCKVEWFILCTPSRTLRYPEICGSANFVSFRLFIVASDCQSERRLEKMMFREIEQGIQDKTSESSA